MKFGTMRTEARGRQARGAAAAGLLVLALLAPGCASVRPGDGIELGPLYARDRAPEGAERVRVAGPLYEAQDLEPDLSFRAVRPFFSDTEDAPRSRRLREFLWPAGILKTFGRETHWRFLLGYGHDFDNTDPASRYRGMVFPFLFWGRDARDEDYLALFPLGGRLNEFLGQDEIVFVLFPAYAWSRVRDIESHNVLWPILSWTRGGDVSRFRFFPFYGYARNGDRWRKQFCLWPFWTHARYGYPQSTGTAWVLFPLVGRVNLSDQQGWMVLPPLFRWSRAADHAELNCPWPFVQVASGRFDKLYLWPLWGRREDAHETRGFWLWPIGHYRRTERPDHVQAWNAVLPFVYSETRRALPEAPADAAAAAGGGGSGEPAAGEVLARYFKLWPLFSYRREDAASRVRLLELWPLKDTGPIERNLAPFWTLYRRTRVGEAVENELLWGLFRSRRGAEGERSLSLFPLFMTHRGGDEQPEARRWSLLLGLLGREREAAATRWRLLWFLTWRNRHGGGVDADGGMGDDPAEGKPGDSQ